MIMPENTDTAILLPSHLSSYNSVEALQSSSTNELKRWQFTTRVLCVTSCIMWALVAVAHFNQWEQSTVSLMVRGVPATPTVRPTQALARPQNVLPVRASLNTRHMALNAKTRTEAPVQQIVDVEIVPEAAESAPKSESSGFDPLLMAGLFFAASPGEAMAKGGEYGILEGKTLGLMHPISMAGLLMLSLFTGYLGWQWRRQREAGNEIKVLKKQLPKLSSAITGSIQDKRAEIQAAIAGGQDTNGVLAADLKALDGVKALGDQIDALVLERKELSGKNLKDRHFTSASALLFVGVTSAIVAPVNTFMRTGKLFPGPHLYAAAVMVTLWAGAASLVPYMQKGNEAARIGHITLNAICTSLFVWQVFTGWDIVKKVWEFAPWP